MLSTYRERVGAEEAFERHVKTLESVGTLGISVDEVDDADLTAIDDAVDVGVPDHASVDFTQYESRAQREKRGRKLRDAAVQRDWLYRP
jgi:hypothetical protein